MQQGEDRQSARVLVLAMGNDILGDDAVGFLAARALREDFESKAEFVETGEAGLALVELLEGYDKALLLDACVTARHEVGTVLEYGPEDFSRVVAPSPHYAGLPEVLDLAQRLELDFPREIRILALEVEDPFTVREGLSLAVEAALPRFIARARQVLGELIGAGAERVIAQGDSATLER
ncbi:MAG: hydrogenase maturation protease [Candidatus Sumerlaeaceae bacterium]|jgi:hydrogenase maturation protease